MQFSKNIPELEKILHTQKAPSNNKLLGAMLYLVLVVANVALVLVALFSPLKWYIAVPLYGISVMLWNILWAVSIRKQIIADQTSISKNRVLFRRFQNTTKYFESILQDTSDIIISLDKEFLILKFNTGAQNLFGHSQAEILGKPFEALFQNPADKDKVYLSEKGDAKSATAVIPMKTKAGQEVIVNMCMSKMRDGGFVVTAQDITEKKYLEELLRKKNEELNRLSITDDLTELYNCRHFYTVIRSELSRLKRHPDRKLSLMYMDVDKFKEFNDAEGHIMGDHVLRALGEVIGACIRKDVDAGFRYGGDEFVITLPDTDMEQAKKAAERILEQFCALKYGNTGLSIGIAEARKDDNEKTLVHRADSAMYSSKKSEKRITLENEIEYSAKS